MSNHIMRMSEFLEPVCPKMQARLRAIETEVNAMFVQIVLDWKARMEAGLCELPGLEYVG